MHHKNIGFWQHNHTFGQDRKSQGEQKTILVAVITASMMVVEIVAGLTSGSMALLADGLHMASHAAALGLNVFAYAYARRHAGDPRFSFGTGKVNALGGFSGAVLLGVFALIMAGESIKRIVSPVGIAFDQAIFVAVIGLVVNGVSAFILQGKEHGHDHAHDHHHHHHDHNLRSAYLHVLADALTSILAIIALLSAKYSRLVWMDPLMGVIGAVLVSRWSLGLLRSTSYILLDREGPEDIRRKVRENIERDGDTRIADLHLWAIGPNIYSAAISVVASHPMEPEQYKKLIPEDLGVVHVTLEVCRCKDFDSDPGRTKTGRF